MIDAIPTCAGDLTEDWLGDVLGRRVGGLRRTAIGQDESFTGGGLFRLSMDEGSLIAKLAPSDPLLRAAFATANGREVAFYTGLAAGLPVPDCAYGNFNPATGNSILLLQDLAECRAGRFTAGIDRDDMAALARSLAAVHAAWWDTPEAHALAGLETVTEFDFVGCWAQYPDRVAALLPEIALPREFLVLGDHVAANWRSVFGALVDQGPVTVLHRDCHVDNVLFAPDGTALLIDWQILGKGRGLWDLVFALISNLSPALRREIEHEILSLYLDELVRRGIPRPDPATVRREYRHAVVARLFISVGATVILDNTDPFRTAWRRADLQRLLAFCADHRIGPQDLAT